MNDMRLCSLCQRQLAEDEEQCASCNGTVIYATGGPLEKSSVFTNILSKKILIGVAVAAVIVIIAIVVLLILRKEAAPATSAMYIKDGELHFVNTKSLKPSEMSDELNYNTEYYSELNIKKSESNQYIFYPGEEEEYGTYTYYWLDTKAQEEGLKKVKIDSEVNWRTFLTKDGSKFFYTKGSEGRFYVYDRKTGEKNKIDDDVNDFYVNDDGSYIVYMKYEEEEASIYEVKLQGLTGTSEKVDVDSYVYYTDMDSRTILYEKNNSIYSKEHGKEKIKLVADSEYLPEIYSTDSFYYLKKEQATAQIHDILIDDLAEINSDMTEPEYPKYPDSPQMPDEYDYQIEAWVDSYYGYERHPETNEWGYWDRVTDAERYNAAYELYEVEYDKWSELAESMEVEYYEQLDSYYAQQEIIDLRETISEASSINYDIYDLYYVDHGTEQLVASNVNYSIEYTHKDQPIALYNKRVISEENAKLSVIVEELGWYDTHEFIEELEDNIEQLFELSQPYYIAYEAVEKELGMTRDEVYTYRFDGGSSLYVLTEYDDEKEHGTLVEIAIAGGKVTAPVKIDEEVNVLPYDLHHNNFYYFKGVKNSSGDLYIGGKLVAEDVYTSTLSEYGEDKLLYFKDYSENSYLGTLTLYEAGQEQKIYDDVGMYTMIDDRHIAFLYDYSYKKSSGDLMIYSDKLGAVLVDYDVSTVVN